MTMVDPNNDIFQANKILKSLTNRLYSISFLGQIGCGKDTQGRKYTEATNKVLVSTGDEFRKHIESGDTLGATVKPYVQKGMAVPDNIVVDTVEKRVNENDVISKGYAITGYPRTVNQAMLHEDRIGAFNRVVVLNITDRDSNERTLSRRICPNCKTIYSISPNAPPSTRPGPGETCKLDGEKLFTRKDDTKEHIIPRRVFWRENEESLKSFFKRRNALVEVDVDNRGTPDQTFKKVASAIAESF